MIMEDKPKQETNPMGKYERKQYFALPKQPTPANEPPGHYQAVTELRGGRPSGWFHIIDREGVSYGCSYAHLIEWIMTPPTMITLMTTTRLFIIEGQNIEKIQSLLLEGKLVALREFNSAIHLNPDDGNAVIIETITIQDQG